MDVVHDIIRLAMLEINKDNGMSEQELQELVDRSLKLATDNPPQELNKIDINELKANLQALNLSKLFQKQLLVASNAAN